MAEWVRLCGVKDAPAEGAVTEVEVQGTSICLARIGGEFAAVVCPWHSWAFNLQTGESEYPVSERVRVFPMRVDGEEILVELGDVS